MVAFLRDEAGQSIVESGLLIGLIALAAVAALSILGKKVGQMFTEINDNFIDITTMNYK